MSLRHTLDDVVEDVFVDGDDQQLQSQRPAVQAARVAHAGLVVDAPRHRQQVNGAAIGEAHLGQGRGNGAVEIDIGDRLQTQRHLGRDAVRRRLGARDGDAHALDRNIGHGFGALDRLSDGVGRGFHVDDGAGADALGLDVADTSDADRLVRLARAFRTHDEAADLRGAQVQRGDQPRGDDRAARFDHRRRAAQLALRLDAGGGGGFGVLAIFKSGHDGFFSPLLR